MSVLEDVLELPAGDSRTTLEGFRVYTPQALRARVFKGLLSELKGLAANVTSERNAVFAMALGSPGKYRKLTIQVMRPSGETLGYVKAGLTQAAGERVRYEAGVLEELSALRPHVPRVLYAGQWQDSYLLFQSPLAGRPGPASLSGMHVEFLERLAALKRVDKPGRGVVEEVGVRWNEVAWRSDWSWQRLGAETLAEARRELKGVTVPCGYSHGDFVPWNTRVREGRLALFDWESCEPETPLGWDSFHFSVQVASVLKRNWRARFDLAAVPGARGLFLLYLLASLGKALDEQADASEGIEYRRGLLEEELACAAAR